MTVPNFLSIIRIILIPVFIVFFSFELFYLAAVIVFISGVTDTLDGFIARRFNQESDLGKLLDPIADKLMQLAMAVCASIKYIAVIPLLAIFFVKELLMLTGSIKLFKKIKKPVASKWYGKLATFAFYASMFLFLVIPHMLIVFQIMLVGVSSLLLIYAFYRYWIVYKSLKEK